MDISINERMVDKIKILITGATSGIGRAMTEKFCKMGHEVVAVGRNTEKLEKIKTEFGCECRKYDLSREEACMGLYETVRNVDVLINNAGFGASGYFSDTPLKKDIDMLAVNVRAPLMLMKLYMRDMDERGGGYILNVGSIAAFMPGAKMSTYYASKAYIVRMTQAVAYENKKRGSKVYVGALCPGPVSTNFGNTADVKFKFMKYANPKDIAESAINGMLSRRTLIFPTVDTAFIHAVTKIIPDKILTAVSYIVNDLRI